MYQRVVAHEAQLLGGVEFVDAQLGDDSVGRSLAAERHALDDVVAVEVGLGLQLQCSGSKLVGLGVAARLSVVIVIGGARA